MMENFRVHHLRTSGYGVVISQKWPQICHPRFRNSGVAFYSFAESEVSTIEKGFFGVSMDELQAKTFCCSWGEL